MALPSYLTRRKSVLQAVHDASDTPAHSSLKRSLGVWDLTAFGIAAVVGAGIFSTIGKASFDGGPGIVLLFILVAIACGFSALCYAEFASMVPASGSAYTYAYVAFGELAAWIIGWDLLMEYAIGNIAVAISWSDYFTSLMQSCGLHIPGWMCMDYWTAKEGASPEALSAWASAPQLAGIRIVCDLPAFLIVMLITGITYIGIQESRAWANGMVILKLAVIALIIGLGAFYVKPENWTPFLPHGLGGVLKGTAAVFFAYIGFDAISTTAEECKNPQRDLPRGMIYSLIICTIIYCLMALVLTGMVNYSQLDVGDPLAYVFEAVNQPWIAFVVSVSAVIATASVLLVFQLGQPRIWMSMSRDGLLPPVFSKIHPKFRTPSFSTLLTGAVVGIPALFLNMNTVIDLTSVGTLFAFVLVCGGILRLQMDTHAPKGSFKTPYINSRWIMPVLILISVMLLFLYNHDFMDSLFRWSGSWADMRTKLPYVAFLLLSFGMAWLSFRHRLSLIPVLGFLSCSYLLCESGSTNWERFLLWLLAGMLVYFLYGRKHSRLAGSGQ